MCSLARFIKDKSYKILRTPSLFSCVTQWYPCTVTECTVCSLTPCSILFQLSALSRTTLGTFSKHQVSCQYQHGSGASVSFLHSQQRIETGAASWESGWISCTVFIKAVIAGTSKQKAPLESPQKKGNKVKQGVDFSAPLLLHNTWRKEKQETKLNIHWFHPPFNHETILLRHLWNAAMHYAWPVTHKVPTHATVCGLYTARCYSLSQPIGNDSSLRVLGYSWGVAGGRFVLCVRDRGGGLWPQMSVSWNPHCTPPHQSAAN